jgi:hypothetical protein
MKVKGVLSIGSSCGRVALARVTDVAKRRRQGLVVCRAALPFEGLFDAGPGVALAPTLLARVACQSRTVRVWAVSAWRASSRSAWRTALLADQIPVS